MAEHENGVGTTTWIQPLVLSLLAGLSTSLGAACVFCLNSKARSNNSIGSNSNKVPSQQPILRPAHMAFSLSLAGSVMVTVSFVSILPESFQDENVDGGTEYRMIPISSFPFLQRCLGFAVGCLLYALLSKCAFPEPDAILKLDDIDDDELEALTLASSRFAEQKTDLQPLMPTTTATPTLRRVSSSAVSIDDDMNKLDATSALVARVQQSNNTRLQRPLASTATMEVDNTSSSSSPSDNDKTDRRFGLWTWTSGSDLSTNSARRAWRVTMLLFLSLAVHNFPEGLAVAASSMHSLHLGLSTTVAIALHNIPEGIAIAIPCLAARPNSPCLAFGLASLSGLFEPLGAVVALFVLKVSNIRDANDTSILSMDNVLTFVAGIMTTVAFIELFPEAWRHSSDSSIPFIVGILTGVAVMIGSETYLASNFD